MYQLILVPVDGSATSERGLREAIRLARLTHADLRLIHVIDELSFAIGIDSCGYYAGELLDLLRANGADILRQATEQVRAQGVPASSVLYENLEKTVQQRVIDEAGEWRADLIVLGTHGRRGVRRLALGSSAERILRSAPVPVLLVRAPEDGA